MSHPQTAPLTLQGVVLPEAHKCQTAIGQKDGYVVLGVFVEGKGAVWVPLEPSVALEVGEQLAKEAYTSMYGTVPPQNALKGAAIERKRLTLKTRCTIIVRQYLERGKKPEQIAERVIDACLHELV